MIARHIVPRLAVAVLLGALTALAGCLPSRVVLDLAPDDGQLESTEVLRDPGAGSATPRIALIDVRGILSHAPRPGLIAASGNPVDDLVAQLNEAERDPHVAAVILRINSPGGTVSASETMFNEIRRFRTRSGKPVVVSAAEVAASGGYYIALAADRIVAQPSTITGSIGVIMQTVNLSDAMQRWGINARSVTSGPNKALASPFETPQERHYAILQGIVNEFYEAFVAHVTNRRPTLDRSRLAEATDGRVFTGAQARDLGLVDDVGDLHVALEHARELIGAEKAVLIRYHAEGRTPRSPYAARANENDGARDVNLIQLRFDDGSLLPRAGFFYLWTPPVAP
ncbi:MAG: signal peptide peptidase SppA [Phycisphaerales bacterium]